jgi:DNA-binding CsgD family transcriptional regulator/predicted negative regulator of RcsB-dependent stress response
MASPFVERESELEALERILAGARQGEGAAAIVEGPAGIGKSRLLASVAAAAGDLVVLRARGSELERDFPFGLVRQLFEPVLVAAVGEERERLLAGAGGLAERTLAGPAADDAGAADAFAVLHGLYWFAANLASVRPVLLLVDDVQWADVASLRWLAFLLHRLDGVPLALVLAVRAGEAAAEEGLLDGLASDPSVTVIRPGVLSDAGAAVLVEFALGDAPDPDFLSACQRATGGNPFLLRELLGELADRGGRATAESAHLVEQLTASGVGRALRARLRRLPRGCLELARAVSVLGDSCELPLAARLAQLEEPAATRAADALANASILEPDRPLTFVHPLVRSSVYGELRAGARSAWHGRAARTLAESGADVDRIAVHVLATDPRADEGTVLTLRAAAESARRRDAHDVAATYLRRALQEPPPAQLKPQLAVELGSAQLRAGQIEAAVEQLTVAYAETTETSTRALVALELAGGLMFTNRAPDAVDVLSDAIYDLPPGEAELTAHLIAMRAVAGWSSVHARRRLPHRPNMPLPASERPRTTGQRLLFAQQAMEEVFTGTAEHARSLALGALGEGELLEVTGAHHPPLYLALNTLIFAHAIEDAERHLQAALDDARRRGSAGGFVLASHFRAAVRWQRGALVELEADAQAALGHEVAPHAVSVAAAHLAEALVARGELEAAAAQLRLAGLDGGTPAPLLGVLAPVARAHLRLAQQRSDEALDLLFECGRFEEAWGIVTPSLKHWRAEAAVLLAQRGEHERAHELAEEAVRRADSFGSPVARGIALRAAALVERPADHDGLRASVTELRGSGARFELARSLVELGAGLRRSGRRSEGREALREGLELAVECGAGVLARRAHEELVAAGAKPRRDPIASRSALTASELRVARMAAEGLTNREIAQALFLTEKTIEVHLTRVYRKLSIQSRSQLPRALPETATTS